MTGRRVSSILTTAIVNKCHIRIKIDRGSFRGSGLVNVDRIGYSPTVPVLNVDHGKNYRWIILIRQSKVDHRIWSWSLERREIELLKCQVLCAACHLDKSLQDGTHTGQRCKWR